MQKCVAVSDLHSGSILFPYTTLFRSDRHPVEEDEVLGRLAAADEELAAAVARRHDAGEPGEVAHEVARDVWRGDEADLLRADPLDRKSTRLNFSHVKSSYAVFCSKKK